MIIIDRIESGFAVCETESGTVDIPLASINGGVCEGDVLIESDGRYAVDTDETARRRESAKARFERLKRR